MLKKSTKPASFLPLVNYPTFPPCGWTRKYLRRPFADPGSVNGKWEECWGSVCVCVCASERMRMYSREGEFLMWERKPGRRGLPGTHKGKNRETKTGWLSGRHGTFWTREGVDGESQWQCDSRKARSPTELSLLFLLSNPCTIEEEMSGDLVWKWLYDQFKHAWTQFMLNPPQ